jgi:hypothetical protein
MFPAFAAYHVAAMGAALGGTKWFRCPNCPDVYWRSKPDEPEPCLCGELGELAPSVPALSGGAQTHSIGPHRFPDHPPADDLLP